MYMYAIKLMTYYIFILIEPEKSTVHARRAHVHALRNIDVNFFSPHVYIIHISGVSNTPFRKELADEKINFI